MASPLAPSAEHSCSNSSLPHSGGGRQTTAAAHSAENQRATVDTCVARGPRAHRVRFSLEPPEVVTFPVQFVYKSTGKPLLPVELFETAFYHQDSVRACAAVRGCRGGPRCYTTAEADCCCGDVPRAAAIQEQMRRIQSGDVEHHAAPQVDWGLVQADDNWRPLEELCAPGASGLCLRTPGVAYDFLATRVRAHNRLLTLRKGASREHAVRAIVQLRQSREKLQRERIQLRASARARMQFAAKVKNTGGFQTKAMSAGDVIVRLATLDLFGLLEQQQTKRVNHKLVVDEAEVTAKRKSWVQLLGENSVAFGATQSSLEYSRADEDPTPEFVRTRHVAGHRALLHQFRGLMESGHRLDERCEALWEDKVEGSRFTPAPRTAAATDKPAAATDKAAARTLGGVKVSRATLRVLLDPLELAVPPATAEYAVERAVALHEQVAADWEQPPSSPAASEREAA